jgi:hypothetical protein
MSKGQRKGKKINYGKPYLLVADDGRLFRRCPDGTMWYFMNNETWVRVDHTRFGHDPVTMV